MRWKLVSPPIIREYTNISRQKEFAEVLVTKDLDGVPQFRWSTFSLITRDFVFPHNDQYDDETKAAVLAYCIERARS